MKKFVICGLMTLGLALVSGDKANAWVNFKFGVGANIDWQSGGNNLLWGAFRGDQVPGAEAYGQPGGFGHHNHFGPQFIPAMPLPAAPATPEKKTTPAEPTFLFGGNAYQSVGYSPYVTNPYYYTPYQADAYYVPMQFGR